MLTYGVTDIAQIIDRRKHTTLGYFISSKYDDMIKPIIENMEPYRFKISARGNIKKDSDILINQIRTISKTRIKEKIAKLTDDEYMEVIENLCKNFR